MLEKVGRQAVQRCLISRPLDFVSVSRLWIVLFCIAHQIPRLVVRPSARYFKGMAKSSAIPPCIHRVFPPSPQTGRPLPPAAGVLPALSVALTLLSLAALLLRSRRTAAPPLAMLATSSRVAPPPPSAHPCNFMVAAINIFVFGHLVKNTYLSVNKKNDHVSWRFLGHQNTAHFYLRPWSEVANVILQFKPVITETNRSICLRSTPCV